MVVVTSLSFLCDPHKQDCWTALISASKEGHIDVVKELLANNANLENRDMVRADRDVLEYSELPHSFQKCFTVMRFHSHIFGSYMSLFSFSCLLLFVDLSIFFLSSQRKKAVPSCLECWFDRF